MDGNLLAFPATTSPFGSSSQMTLRPPWVRDLGEVATVTMTGNLLLLREGIMDGDTLIVNLRFDESKIKLGTLVLARSPKGRREVKRFEPGMTVEAIVKELNRKLV